MPSSWLSSGRDALLAAALALSGANFVSIQWRWNEAPMAARAVEFLASGADYEAARFEDGIGSPGWCWPLVQEWARRVPLDAVVAAQGPWEIQRAARYYLYPRRVYTHQGAGPAADVILAPGRPLPTGAGPPPQPSPAGALVFARILAAIAAVGLAGFGIATRAFPRGFATGAGLLSTAWLLGTIAVALWSILLTWLGVPFSLATDAILVIGAAALARRPRGPFAPADDGKIAAVPLALIVLQVGVGILYALHGAPGSGDDMSEWMLKAKHYHATGALSLPGPPHEWALAFHDYPPLVPALLALVYRGAGGVADGPAKLVFALFLAALLGALYDGLRAGGLSRARALALAALLAISGNEVVNHAGYAWADLALAAFGVAGAAALARGVRDGDDRALALGGILLGGGALTKLEGVPAGLALVAAVALVASGRRKRAPLAAGLAFAALAGAWAIHCALRGYHPASEHVATLDLARLPAVLPGYLAAFANEYRFASAFAVPAIGLAIAAARRFPAAAAVPALGFAAALALPLGAYVITVYSGQTLLDHVGYTAGRLLLHALPMGFLAAGLGVFGPGVPDERRPE